MRRSFFALPAAAALAACIMPLPAFAQQSWEITVQDSGAEITWTDADAVDVQIPAQADGQEVTAIAAEGFSGCAALERIEIPDTVTVIGDYAFQNCTSLETITIPASVTQIGNFAFEGCTSLREISVEEDNEAYCSVDGVLMTKDMSMIIRYPAAKADTFYEMPEECDIIAAWGFTGCRYLEETDLNEVRKMGADVFMGCTALQKVTLTNHITELIGASFAHCTALRTVSGTGQVRTIGDNCFFGCAELTDIGNPERLESVGKQAFYGCVSLKELHLPASLRSIGEYGIGYSVTEDGENALIPDVCLYMPIGSKAYRYARENGLKFQASMPENALMITLVVLLLAGLGIAAAVIKHKEHAAEEAAKQERLRAEERAQKKQKRSKRKGQT